MQFLRRLVILSELHFKNITCPNGNIAEIKVGFGQQEFQLQSVSGCNMGKLWPFQCCQNALQLIDTEIMSDLWECGRFRKFVVEEPKRNYYTETKKDKTLSKIVNLVSEVQMAEFQFHFGGIL